MEVRDTTGVTTQRPALNDTQRIYRMEDLLRQNSVN